MHKKYSFHNAAWVFTPVLQYAHQFLGLSPKKILMDINMEEADTVNSTLPVDYKYFGRLLLFLRDYTGDPFIGYKIGSSVNMYTGHFLDYLVRSCDTTFEAVRKMDYYNYQLSDYLYQKHKTDGTRCIVFIATEQDWLLQNRESGRILIDCVLSFTYSLIKKLSGGLCLPSQIGITRRVANVEFDFSMFNTFPTVTDQFDYLIYENLHEIKIHTSNMTVKETLEKKMAEFPTVAGLKHNWTNKIRWHLQGAKKEILSINMADVANTYHMSARKLQRLLACEGIQFRDLVNEVKSDYIKSLLIEENFSVKNTAYRIGYENPISLSAFFKRLSGESISQFKKRVQPGEARTLSDV